MDKKEILEQFGLHGRKTDVYLAALELGGASVVDISKKAGIKRTTCYDILLDLEKEGLITTVQKGKKRLFVGENPEKIKKDMARKESLFSEILPELKSIYNVRGTKPKIRFYEGREGLIEAYDDALEYPGEILVYSSQDVINVLGPEWAQWYIKKRVKKNIRIRAILPKTEWLEKNIVAKDKEQLRICKFVDLEKFPFSVEIDVYGGKKVAIISNKEKMAVIIESSEIANTLKHVFELAWLGVDFLENKKASAIDDENYW
jgi:HTH-type transcriptional regulator, sugar sensing transcriptional regulator